MKSSQDVTLVPKLECIREPHLGSGLLENLSPSGMTDQECTVSTAPFSPPPPTTGRSPVGCVCECMNTLLGLPSLIPSVGQSTTPSSNSDSPAVTPQCISYFCLSFTQNVREERDSSLSSPPAQLCCCTSCVQIQKARCVRLRFSLAFFH